MKQKEKKTTYNFGFRGWMLIIWIATAFLSYIIIGNYPLNILSDLYGGAQTLSMIYTSACIIGIVIQILLSNVSGKTSRWKLIGSILGIVSLICLLGIILIAPGTLWKVVYGVGTCVSSMYGTYALSILIGQWFPTRKGTVMGVATFAFPIGNAFLGTFASTFFGKFGDQMANIGDSIGALIAQGMDPEAAEAAATASIISSSAITAFLPFFIVILVGLVIGIVFVKDYPEQCGAFRDNNKNMTLEIAKAMMEQEMENKKTTVWKTSRTLLTTDFWMITIPMGILLMFSIGTMTQSNAILSPFEEQYAFMGGYTGVMMLNTVFGIIGSFAFGLVDTKFGTKFAVRIATIFMIAAGILGLIPSAASLFVALIFIGLFLGAASNFTVSAAVQYWRREDFPSVFSCVNPIANLISAFGPMLVAALLFSALGYRAIFLATLIAGILGLICALLFKPSRIKARDDKLRAAAGKPLDDALVGRK